MDIRKFIKMIPVTPKWQERIDNEFKAHYREGIVEGVRLGKMNAENERYEDKIAKLERRIEAYENTVKMKEKTIDRLKVEKKQEEVEHKEVIKELTENLRKERAIRITENDIQKVLMDVYINSDFSKEEIAEKTEIDVETLNNYIKGHSIPCNEHLNRMSIAFGVDLGNYCIKQIGGVKNDK